MDVVAKLRYMARQYSAGQNARGGGSQKHYLEEAADMIDALQVARDMAENKAELLAEEIECIHMALDKVGVPRYYSGVELSMWGRVIRFKDMPANA